MASSFDSFGTLCTALADWLNRADITARIPDFIRLCEGEVNADDRFRVLPGLVRATAPASGQYLPLPNDYISMSNFRILEAPPPGRVDMLTQTQMDDKRAAYQVAGVPRFYTVIGEEMELLPVPDQTYTVQMVYYANVPPLSAENPSNWLLQRYPQIYLYGSLKQSAPYLKDDSRIATWESQFEADANKIQVSSDRGQFSGSTMKMRTPKRYR